MDLLKKLNVKRDSAKILLAINLLTIAMAWVFNWSLLTLLWGYWLQSVIIGFFTVLKLIRIGIISASQNIFGLILGFFMAGFFAFHYGMFHLVYSIFLSAMSVGIFSDQTPMPSLNTVDWTAVLIIGASFFIHHAYSFIRTSFFAPNVTVDPESKTGMMIGDLGKTMFSPYSRILPMHMTIILGIIIIILFSFTGFAEKLVITLFMLLKTGADLSSHNDEHQNDPVPVMTLGR